MSTPLFLGIDLGTSALKLLAVASDGRPVASAEAPIETLSPHPGWSEQEPTGWWSALRAACAALFERDDVSPEDIEAVGLSGQMHGAVLLDAGGEALRPCLIWADARTAEQVGEIEQAVPRADLIRITGNRSNTRFTAAKLLWVRRHEPEIYARTRRVLLPKDYLRYRLTGEYATDVSDASATLMFDLARRDWSDDLLRALSIERDLLPQVHESSALTGYVTPEAARATGLRVGTPVVAGGGDAPCAALGMGLMGEEDNGGSPLLSSIGTSGQVFAVTPSPLVDPAGRVHSLCYVLPGRWFVMGAILAGGVALSWLRDLLSGPSYDTLAAEARGAGVGAGGVIFLPYLMGERTPHMDPDATGTFTGLRLHHTRAHLARAVMEGVAFALRDGLEVLREIGIAPTEVRPAGGGARIVLWKEIQRDVFDLPARGGLQEHGAAYGAALLAAMGVGAADVLQGAHSSAGELSPPNPANVAEYNLIYRRYSALYPALSERESKEEYHAV